MRTALDSRRNGRSAETQTVTFNLSLYETEDGGDDDWEVAGTPDITHRRETIAEVDPVGEGVFEGDDCAVVRNGDGVEVAVEGMLTWGTARHRRR